MLITMDASCVMGIWVFVILCVLKNFHNKKICCV